MKTIMTILALALGFFTASAQKNQSHPIEPAVPAQFAAIQVQLSARDGQPAIKVVRAMLKPGVYKKEAAPFDFGYAGDLRCLILDGEMKPLDSLWVKNPLRVRMEFPSDNGEIGSTVLEYPEQELLIRFNYDPRMQHLQFWQIGTPGRWEHISTFPLNFE